MQWLLQLNALPNLPSEMKGKVLLGVFLLSLTITAPTSATVKTKPVKMLALPTLAKGSYFQGAGGQWFNTLISQRSLYLVGTSEPTGAPTQGEVIAINSATGEQQWDLPIPTSTDAIATAATLDTAGNIWVAGSTGLPIATPTPTPTPTSALNPGGVTVDPVVPTRTDLTQITVWQVSQTGSLLNTFTYDAGAVVQPLSVTYAKGSLLIGGSDFQVSLSTLGKFSKFIKASFVQPQVSTTSLLKDGLYIWKSYLSKGAIPGVSGWKPTTASPVILKVGSRTGKVYAAYKVLNPILKIEYRAGVGVVVTTQSQSGYAISLLK
jgi:hypothetical protein